MSSCPARGWRRPHATTLTRRSPLRAWTRHHRSDDAIELPSWPSSGLLCSSCCSPRRAPPVEPPIASRRTHLGGRLHPALGPRRKGGPGPEAAQNELKWIKRPRLFGATRMARRMSREWTDVTPDPESEADPEGDERGEPPASGVPPALNGCRRCGCGEARRSPAQVPVPDRAA